MKKGFRRILTGCLMAGLLLAAQIILPRINRSPSVRQTVEFVLPI